MVLRFAVVGLVLLTACSNPQPVEDGETSDVGVEFFEARCAACHGLDGKAGLSGASDLSVSTLTDDEIRKVIMEGRNAMQPFKLLIDSDESLEKTIAHVKSLRTK